MDKKGCKSNPVDYRRRRKRSFHGNRHTVETDTNFTSVSATKLREREDTEIPVSKQFAYCILNFFTVFTTICDGIKCKTCDGNIILKQSVARGLGFYIIRECQCGLENIPSCPLINNAFEINRRLVFVMRLLGVGREGINLFCGLMDLGKGLAVNTYYSCLENMYTATTAVYEQVLKRAVAEEKEKNKQNGNPENELTVSGDGTWKKRGFSSLFGVVTLIGKYSKKVVDVAVKSAFCQACNLFAKKFECNDAEFDDWFESHQENCTANHHGSAGKMETDGVAEMFSTSVEKHGVKYSKYIGDGDSKTFKGLLDIDPYNGDPIVQKKECVGHIEKRMGTRLRNAKRTNKGIGGKGAGKLTDKVIGELTKYYGLAIRRNSNSVEDMKKEVWATFYHKSSTDVKPQHSYCPPGKDSWCKWRKAEANGTFHHHQPPLISAVLQVIKPIYEDLTATNLLERCLGAETQNNNESLNSLIWTFAPKHVHSGVKIVKIATYLATSIFNEGFLPILSIMDIMGITIGSQAEFFAATRDEKRIHRSEQRVSDAAKKARIAKREELSAQQDFFEEEEGILYGPGIAE